MSNRARTQFECDGVAFDVGRLNLNDSCKGLELLAKLAAPVLGTASQGEAAAIAALLGQSSRIPELIGLFAPMAKVGRDSTGAYGAGEGFGMVELKPFVEQVFTSRLELACLFIAKCVLIEFGPFIESARTGALAQVLAQA